MPKRISIVVLLLALIAVLPLSLLAEDEEGVRETTADEDRKIDSFKRGYGSADPKERAQAVMDLSGVDHPEGASLVLSVIKNEAKLPGGTEVLEKAADAIGKWRKEDTLEYIIDNGIGNSKWEVVYYCVDGLGKTTSIKVLPTLIEKLKHDIWQVRFAAATGINQYKKSALKTAGEAVADALSKESVDKVIVALIDAAAAIGGKDYDEPVAMAVMNSENWRVISTGAKCLSDLRSKKGIGVLIEALDRTRGRAQDDVLKALRSLTGKQYGAQAKIWRGWWAKAGDEFVVPPKGMTANVEGELRSVVTYHGIPTTSQFMVFCLDISNSMNEAMKIEVPTVTGPGARKPYKSGTKVGIAKEELLYVLEQIKPSDTYVPYINIIAFETKVKAWQKSLVKMTSGNKKKAAQWIQALSAPDTGRTNIYGALIKAFSVKGLGLTEKGYRSKVDTIFLLSDGEPTAGDITNDDDIVSIINKINRVEKVVIHCIAFGRGSHHQLLQRLAADNGGAFVVINEETSKKK